MNSIHESGLARVKNHMHAGRPKETESRVFYCRLKLPDYETLTRLGGKPWLLKKIREERKRDNPPS